jgi:glyoxylase-like metal-dependent hydrolase (beta-lactamase superfamily II)
MVHPAFFLKQLEVGPMENFVYLLGDPETREAMVVDPAWQVDTILKTADQEGYKITGALISHHHYDHTNGIEDLLNATDAKIYVNKHDAEFIKVGRPNLVKTDHGQQISIGNLQVQLIHTPGHTPGSQCFHVQNHLVSGDTLFIKGCGRQSGTDVLHPHPKAHADGSRHRFASGAQLCGKTHFHTGERVKGKPLHAHGRFFFEGLYQVANGSVGIQEPGKRNDLL